MSQLNKYEFAITIDNAESGEFIFAIAATDKSSGRTSQINFNGKKSHSIAAGLGLG